jgi:4-amino-4-deoxychorismate lyase
VESPFRRPLPDGLTLIETFGRNEGGFVNLPLHLARLERTARALGLAFEPAGVERALAGVAGEGPLRVRLTLDLAGRAAATAAPLAPGPAVWRLAVAEERLDPDDPWLRVKTSERGRYDRARAVLPAGVDEWLFLNNRGEICEGTITNVFLKAGGTLLTPPLACGLLPGVLRGLLLAEGRAREAVLRPGDLALGEIFVGNSLRGLVPARLAG